MSFLEDREDLSDRIATAVEQARRFDSMWPYGSRAFERVLQAERQSLDVYSLAIKRISGGVKVLADNHGRGVSLPGGYGVMGNAGDLRQVITDMNIGAALDLPQLDVLTNSVGTIRLGGLAGSEESASESAGDPTVAFDTVLDAFSSWHIAVASRLATLRIPNTYQPGQSYRQEIEDLRAHPNVRAFRDMLVQRDPEAADVTAAATEITEMANAFARKQMTKKYTKRPWYRTVGQVAIGPAGNAIHPGLGSAITGSLKIVEYVKHQGDRSIGSWAAFVTSIGD